MILLCYFFFLEDLIIDIFFIYLVYFVFNLNSLAVYDIRIGIIIVIVSKYMYVKIVSSFFEWDIQSAALI